MPPSPLMGWSSTGTVFNKGGLSLWVQEALDILCPSTACGVSGNACCRLHKLPALSLGLLQLEQTQRRHLRAGTGWGQTPCSISTPYDDLTNVVRAEHSFINSRRTSKHYSTFFNPLPKRQRQKKRKTLKPAQS